MNTDNYAFVGKTQGEPVRMSVPIQSTGHAGSSWAWRENDA